MYCDSFAGLVGSQKCIAPRQKEMLLHRLVSYGMLCAHERGKNYMSRESIFMYVADLGIGSLVV